MDGRPCRGCERYVPGEPFVHGRDCRFCWLYHNDPRYRAKWDGQPVPLRPERPKKYPSALEQANNLRTARKEWIEAGKPLRSDAEYARLHAICEACPLFDAEEDRCTKCGCPLSDKSRIRRWTKLVGLPDAIRMATKHCPIDKW